MKIGLPDIILKDISDEYIRENFFRLQEFFAGFPFFRGQFKHFEYKFDRALTKQKVRHGLGFKPTDIIQTRLIGPGELVWEYAEFDDKNLVVTTTDACQVRAFVGAYREDT